MKLAVLTVPLATLLYAAAAQAQEGPPPAGEGTPPVALTAEDEGAPVAAAAGERWAVLCEQTGEGPCVIRQHLLRQEDRRQIMMAGLLPGAGGEAASMRLVLPFGIDPTAPVAIGVDGEPLASPPLRTCLPAGCEVVVALDAEGLALLREGTRMDVRLTIAGGGNFVLPVDLAGFSAAFDRAVEGQGEGEQAQ